VAAASLAIFGVQSIFKMIRRSRSSQPATLTTPSSYVARHGGWAILPFQMARLLFNSALLVLLVVTGIKVQAWGNIALALTSVCRLASPHTLPLTVCHLQAYATSLSALLLLVPVVESRSISFHATLASLAIFVAYIYRDLWPLLTFVFAPADAHEGWLIWIKIALVGVASFIVPVCEPFPYIPIDPEVPALQL
jgi:hypothetical protein